MANDEYDIFECCRRNDVEGLKTIIRLDPNIKDNNGSTPLHIAAYYNFKDCLQILIQLGADVTIKGGGGHTSLHYAAINDSKECLQLLLEAGANINAKDRVGITPLHIAAYYNSKECLELLLDLGADINAKNDDGETFLDCIEDEQFRKEMEDHIQSISSLDIKEPSC